MRQLELPAISARDRALARVSGHSGEWMPRAMIALEWLPAGQLTGEDIRLRLIHQVGAPHHHNAWGALIRHGIKGGLLVATGEYRKMITLKSHARKTPVYRIK